MDDEPEEQEKQTPKQPRIQKSQALFLGLVALLVLGGAGVWFFVKNKAESNAMPADGVFDKPTLAKFDGKKGHKCFVAVDGTVYEIIEGNLWKNGQHSTSNGQAYCGADLSEAIKKSPHGKAKLTTLEKVGTFKPDEPIPSPAE